MSSQNHETTEVSTTVSSCPLPAQPREKLQPADMQLSRL